MKKILLVVLLFASCTTRYRIEPFDAKRGWYNVVESVGGHVYNSQICFSIEEAQKVVVAMKRQIFITDSINAILNK